MILKTNEVPPSNQILMKVRNKTFIEEIRVIEAILPEKEPNRCYNACVEVFDKHPAHPVLTTYTSQKRKTKIPKYKYNIFSAITKQYLANIHAQKSIPFSKNSQECY